MGRRRTHGQLAAEWAAQMDRHDEIWLAGAQRILARAR